MQFNKAYVLCPVNQTTGGPEALHQLASALKLQGIEAYISYFDKNGHLIESDVPEVYQVYDVSVCCEIDDQPATLIVFPETATYLLSQYRLACRVIWWLSIDNYFTVRGTWFRQVLRRLLLGKQLFEFGKKYDRLLHVAQSHYAQQQLSELGVNDAQLLTDYLRDSFLLDAEYSVENKRNIVVYNPKKGIETTQRIMGASSLLDLEWIPLINMTPLQVADLLKIAKVYIDFGEHPGRDRIPREAALYGCVVLTGQKGSAGNPVDVPIPLEYKFADDGNPDEVCSLISEVMTNYSVHHDYFDRYRHWIRQNKACFYSEVQRLMANGC